MPSANSTPLSIDDLQAYLIRFTVTDYGIFVTMLICCILIGLYFGLEDHKKRKKTINRNSESQANEYLMGGRNMPIVPISLSLIASLVSGNLILGTATEMYIYGMQYFYATIGYALCGVVMHFIIIPVFHDMQITSAYEYLQRRFEKRLRTLGSIMFIAGVNMFLPIVIYVPALAFNQTTNVNIHIITPVVMIICIFYTCLGGMKAVVWTDVLQIVILYVTLTIVAVKGTLNVGGLTKVFDRNLESGRIQYPDFNLDPTIRHSFWTVVIGYGALSIAGTGLNQSVIQRFLALKTMKKARLSNAINVCGVILMLTISCYNGLLVYATYYNCDPLTTGLAKAKDQLLPLMVMENFTDIPGLAGFFVAGIFAAALSTLSTAYNGMAAVVFEDFFRANSKAEFSELQTFLIMRGTVLVLGSISVALVYVVQNMGQLLQLTFTLPSTSHGPMLGVFTIGLLLPWIGKRATFYSVVSVYAACLIFVLKTQMEVAKGTISFHERPVSIEGCIYNVNNTSGFVTTPIYIENSTITPEVENGSPERGISYLYFTLLGALSVIALSTILSVIFGFEDPKSVDPQCLAPFMRKYFKSDNYNADDQSKTPEVTKF